MAMTPTQAPATEHALVHMQEYLQWLYGDKSNAAQEFIGEIMDHSQGVQGLPPVTAHLFALAPTYVEGDLVGFRIELRDSNGDPAEAVIPVSGSLVFTGTTTMGDWLNNPTTIVNDFTIPIGSSFVIISDTLIDDGIPDTDWLAATLVSITGGLSISGDDFVSSTITDAPVSATHTITDAPVGGSSQLLSAVNSYASNSSTWYSARDTYNGITTVTGEQQYNMWPALYGMSYMHRWTSDNSYLQKGVDFALKYINDGQDLAGITGHGNYVPLDGFPDWRWGNSGNPSSVSYDHYDWRGQAGIGQLLLELHRSNATVSPANAKTLLRNFLVMMWQKWTITPPSYDNPLYNQQSTFQARWSQVAMALDQTDATPGNNDYATYLNTGSIRTWCASIQTRIASNNNDRLPPYFDGRNSVQEDLSHANDHIAALATLADYGYNPGGYLTVAFFNNLANHFNTTVWVPGQTYPARFVDGSGQGNSRGKWCYSFPLLGANNSNLLDRFRTLYLSGNHGIKSNRGEILLHYAAVIYDSEQRGPRGA